MPDLLVRLATLAVLVVLLVTGAVRAEMVRSTFKRVPRRSRRSGIGMLVSVAVSSAFVFTQPHSILSAFFLVGAIAVAVLLLRTFAFETTNSPSFARGPTPAAERTLSGTEQDAELVLFRESHLMAGAIWFEVFVDDAHVGSVADGGTLQVAISPGVSHSVYVKLDWCRSPVVTVSAQAGQSIEMGCAPEAGLIASLIKPRQALGLRLLRQQGESG